MSTIPGIYKSLFAGKKLTIRLASFKDYESLRTALCKQHRIPKYLLETTTDSLCANYDDAQGVGTFWVGPPSRSTNQVNYQIVKEQDL